MAVPGSCWLVLLAFTGYGCSREAPVVASQPGEAPLGGPGPEEASSVLFGLATRDHEIWLHPGGRYTIKKKDGSVLASEIDEASLERDFPELAADLAGMVDVNDGGQPIGVGGYDD